jgi:cysteine synthase
MKKSFILLIGAALAAVTMAQAAVSQETLDNLNAAFQGESNAAHRDEAFAKKADAESHAYGPSEERRSETRHPNHFVCAKGGSGARQTGVGVAAALAAGVGSWAVYETGHRGGALVYQHGAGVNTSPAATGGVSAVGPQASGRHEEEDRD